RHLAGALCRDDYPGHRCGRIVCADKPLRFRLRRQAVHDPGVRRTARPPLPGLLRGIAVRGDVKPLSLEWVGRMRLGGAAAEVHDERAEDEQRSDGNEDGAAPALKVVVVRFPAPEHLPTSMMPPSKGLRGSEQLSCRTAALTPPRTGLSSDLGCPG